MTDEQAMIAVRDGNLDMAAILYERYKKPLLNFFLYRHISYDNASDLTQQVFWRLLQYRLSYRSEAVFKTWVYEIARNVFNDFVKKNPVTTNISEIQDLYDEPNDSEDQYQFVHRALAQLPEQAREVLTMSRFQNMTYEEIGQVLGLSVSNVKVRVFRAMQKLRDAYFEISEQ
jgi:RNA polymerase sigma factor (sigma-70 family)